MSLQTVEAILNLTIGKDHNLERTLKPLPLKPVCQPIAVAIEPLTFSKQRIFCLT